MNRLSAVVLTLLLCSTAVRAQSPGIDYEKILLPLTPAPLINGSLPGRFGSQWQVDFWLRNDSGRAVSIFGYIAFECNALCIFQPDTPPNITIHPFAAFSPDALPYGRILNVDREFSDDIRFMLRVRELSRPQNIMGTEVPVVRERDFREDQVHIIGVPLDERFRNSLKIYDPDARRGGAAVTLRVFAIDPEQILSQGFFGPAPPDRLLGQRTVLLIEGFPRFTVPGIPGFAEIVDLRAAFGIPEEISHVRIEVEPVTPGLRFWAFVTLISNDTQQVSIFSPQ